MDFDPRITSDGSSLGNGYGAEHGWDCNFNFGYGHDVIDEDAESEKCCAQALRFMIAKADAEIHDLEDELAILQCLLQCQLKWAKSDKERDPFEVCCAAFKRKIDSLTSSIQSMKNGNDATSREVMDEALEIQRPAERIYDIINALVRHNFSETSEQQATSLESSIESEKQKAVAERTEKPELTISEESSSDAARYAVQDTKEGRDMGKSDDEVARKAELSGAYRCTSEEKTGFLTLNHVMTPTYLPASTSEGNPKLGASQQGESEKYITKSETGESGSLPLSAELIVKAEEDYDINIQQVAVNSLSKLQDHERDDPFEDHLKVTENQSQSIISADITYGRKKSNLSSVLKPQGMKVPRKPNPNPTLTRKIRKKRSPSNAENSTQSGSPSNKDGKFSFLQETNTQRKVKIEEEIVHANASRVSGAKRRQIQGTRKESPTIRCLGEKVSEGEPLSARAISVSPHLDSDSTNQHGFGPKSAIVEDLPMTEIPSPSYDWKNLRLKLSQDPEFLKKLKVPELKGIMRENKLHGLFKYKKEKIIEELTKRLNP